MRFRLRPAAALLLLVVAAWAGRAETPAKAASSAETLAKAAAQPPNLDSARPVVAGYEHLRLAVGTSDAAMGEVLLGELNCLSCHTVSDASRNAIAERITTKPAPDLATLGHRATPGWLSDFLNDPHREKPGATMPDVLHGLPAEERAVVVDRLVHFLIDQSRQSGQSRQSRQSGQSGDTLSPGFETFRFRATVERGRRLFHSIGCVACHAAEPTENEANTSAIPDVPLPDLAAKTSVASLVKFLMDPTSARHGGRMPSFYLTDEEARDLAVYLLRDQEPELVRRVSGFEFEYFLDPLQDEDAEGFFDRPPPDFDALRVEDRGRIETLSLDLPIDTHWGNHMFRYGGLLPVKTTGIYTFVLRSDRRSGSALLIDGEVVATKDPNTGRDIPFEAPLEAGDHSIEITYYIRGDTEEPYLEVTVQSDAIAQPTSIDRIAIFENVRLAPPVGAFTVDPKSSRQGRRAFREHGCAACHALPAAASGAVPIASASSLKGLDPATLTSDGPIHRGIGAPRYRLDAHQRRAIGAALANLDALSLPRNASAQIVHTLATYNCFACHQRGDVGGLDPARRRHFKVVDGMDLGDEGRIPPKLTGIGGKLKPEALDSVLRGDRQHVRGNYMEARMPRFGSQRGDLLGNLPADFERTDAKTADMRAPRLSPEAIEDGRTLVGSTGLRCITCHSVGTNLAQGISTVNLSTVYDRLRPGWVRQLLLDPHSLNPDTRMVPYWSEGIVLFPDIAGGTANGQIDAILSYMSLGESMPAPAGTNIGDTMVLVPNDEPIVFRTFMTGVSPRAIVVGYPEGVHVAFDANVMRLAKAWRGGFFDAQGTWSGRAGRFLDAYGDDLLRFPPGPALAFLENYYAPWPTVRLRDRNVGGRFTGYRLDERRRPIFSYKLHDVLVEEQLIPAVRAGGATLVRRFALEAGEIEGQLYLLAAEGDDIVSNDDGSWSVDGKVAVVAQSSAPMTPIMRSSQGVRQLLLPIVLEAGGVVSLELEISW